jgi:AcrR family transcriptional regulator
VQGVPAVPSEPKRGRPLDPAIDDAIVRAAVAVFLEGGLQRMTVPGVATMAGVAKTTVYRRYPTPASLALAAIARLNLQTADPDTGSTRTDLIATLEATRARLDPTVTATVLVEAQTHPEILEIARRNMIVPAIERFRRVLRRGVERGELRADLDIQLAADTIFGPLFLRHYEHGRPGPEWPEHVVDHLYPGLVAPGPK